MPVPGRVVLLFGCVLAAAALAFDLWLPLGVAGGLPYVVLVLLGLWASGPGPVIALALAGSLLTVLGFALSDPGSPTWVVLINRGLALFVIWSSALLVVLQKRQQNALAEARSGHDVEMAIHALELMDSEQRFRDFADLSSDWLWETDADLRFIRPTDGNRSGIAAPPDYAYGKTLQELLGDDFDHDAWDGQLRKLQDRKSFRNFTYVWPGTDEFKERWLSTSGQPYYDADGSFLGYRGTGRDASEGERAQLALETSEAQVRLLLDSTGEAIYGIDLDGHCTFANPACAKILGYDGADELLGRQMHELIHHTKTDGTPYDHEDCKIYRAFRQGESVQVDDEVLWRRDGTAFPAEYSSFPILRDDAVIGAVVTFVDTTEKHDVREALASSEERFRSLLEYAPFAIVLQDLDARIQLVNSTYEHFFVFPPDRLIGSVAPELFGAGLAERLNAADRQVIKTGAVVELDADVVEQDLPVKFIRITKFPVFQSGGEISGVGSFVLDISAQKMAEERLVQTHKMEAISQLTGGIAHDFNNLLTAVMGNLDLLRDHLEGDVLAQKYLATAYRASEHGAGLTDHLLAFSRRQELTAEIVDINDVVDDFSRLAARTLGEDIRIEPHFPEDIWLVTADPGQLENAMLNLALNARGAMSGGGLLRIETSNQVLDDAMAARHEDLEPGDYVMIEVIDEGVGMSPETLARAFEPFFTTRKVGEGSGLGLSMVFGFTKQTGGHVVIESELEMGTSVRLYLPRAPKETSIANAGPAASNGIPTGVETVLVVEDQADLRSFVINLLSRLGYRTLEAEDGPAAMPLLEGEGRIDMLLTDVVLPAGMSGADLARTYRQRFPDGKVLYTSGYPGDELSKSGRLPQDVDLLRKPYQAAELAQTVRQVLDS